MGADDLTSCRASMGCHMSYGAVAITNCLELSRILIATGKVRLNSSMVLLCVDNPFCMGQVY